MSLLHPDPIFNFFLLLYHLLNHSLIQKSIILTQSNHVSFVLTNPISRILSPMWFLESIEQPVESLSDDFLFPMNTSRLSYASSPESDLEMGPGPSSSLSLGNLPALVKASSDPSIATNQDNLERDRDLGDGMGLMPPPYTVSITITFPF